MLWTRAGFVSGSLSWLCRWVCSPALLVSIPVMCLGFYAHGSAKGLLLLRGGSGVAACIQIHEGC